MTTTPKTLRLLMPQWQGGANPTYVLGAHLLSWLAPEGEAEFAEVPVDAPHGNALSVEDGTVAKSAVLRQDHAAREIIERARPDRIVTFGGDCSVSLAPFSYLAEKYAGDVAMLWIDSHLDLTSSKHSKYAHGYPALNLLGEGDEEFAAFATSPIPGDKLIYVGVGKAELSESSIRGVQERGASLFDPSEISADFSEVLEAVRKTGAKKLLVHFDLDVLDPRSFRSQLFSQPYGALASQFVGEATGKMTFAQVIDLLNRASGDVEIVALSITEHLPWDVANIRDALAQLPILSR